MPRTKLFSKIFHGISNAPKSNTVDPPDCIKHVSLNQILEGEELLFPTARALSVRSPNLNQIFKGQESMFPIGKLNDRPKKLLSGSRGIGPTQHPRPQCRLWDSEIVRGLVYPVGRYLT